MNLSNLNNLLFKHSHDNALESSAERLQRGGASLSKPKNLLIFSILSLFALQMAGLVFLVAAPVDVWAANDPIYFMPQVPIPGSIAYEKYQDCLDSGGTKLECSEDAEELISGSSIAEYIQAWYKFAIAAVGILATVMVMGGGLIWLTAGGNQSRIGTAKEWISGAVIGLVLALVSYTLLEILNPSLVTFKSLVIDDVGLKTLDTCLYMKNKPSSSLQVEKEITTLCGLPTDEQKEYGCYCPIQYYYCCQTAVKACGQIGTYNSYDDKMQEIFGKYCSSSFYGNIVRDGCDETGLGQASGDDQSWIRSCLKTVNYFYEDL